MTPSTKKQSFNSIIITTTICIALIGITVTAPEMQELRMFPTQVSNISSNEMMDTQIEMDMICADGYCSKVDTEIQELPSSLNRMSSSIQNAIEETINWFDNVFDNIQQKMNPSNLDEFIAAGK